MYYRVIKLDDYLAHKGVEGMRLGYNDGKRNGKRTAKNKPAQSGYQANKYTKSVYEMDDEDREWQRNHENGTDTRTWEEYCDDRWEREEAEAKQKEEEEAAKKAKEEEEKKKKSTSSSKANAAGKATRKALRTSAGRDYVRGFLNG